MKIFSGSSNKPLAEKIARTLDLELSPLEIFIFPDEEKRIRIEERVVDENCIVVQPTATPADQNYMELLFIVDGLKRSGAKSITAIIPYLGYQRQDHIFRSGEAVSLDVVAHALERTGVTKVIAFDLHSIKIPEVFSIQVSHLSALPLFAEKIKDILNSKHEIRNPKQIQNTNDKNSKHFKNLNLENSKIVSNFDIRYSDLDCVLVSPDMGGLRRIKKMSEFLANMPWLATVKDRDLATGAISTEKFYGDGHKIKKRVFIIDDMISSGGTMVKAAELLKKEGAEEIFAFATHAVFSDDAAKILQESEIEKVFVTDSVFVPQEKKFPKLEVLSIGEIIAKELREEVKS